MEASLAYRDLSLVPKRTSPSISRESSAARVFASISGGSVLAAIPTMLFMISSFPRGRPVTPALRLAAVGRRPLDVVFSALQPARGLDQLRPEQLLRHVLALILPARERRRYVFGVQWLQGLRERRFVGVHDALDQGRPVVREGLLQLLAALTQVF